MSRKSARSAQPADGAEEEKKQSNHVKRVIEERKKGMSMLYNISSI